MSKAPPAVPPWRPSVSVIVPAYNAARYVAEALQSITEQGHAPLEVLLVDDGSTDDTVTLVRRQFPAVRVISQPNAGVAEARNTGLRHARGDLICLLDADDGWYPGKLRAQIEHLRTHPETGAVYHAWRVWAAAADGSYPALPAPPQGQAGEIVAELSGWIYPQLLLDCVVHTSSIMIRREFVEQLGGFRADLVNGEDYDYWLRLSRLTRIDKLAGVYSFYRAAPGSLTSSVKTVNYEYEVVCAALHRWGRQGPDGRSLPPMAVRRRLGKLAFDFAYAHLRGGSPTLARRAALRCVRHDPRRLKALLFVLASFLPALRRWR